MDKPRQRLEDGHLLEPTLRKLLNRRKLSPEDQTAVLSLPHTVKTVEAHNYIVREFDKPRFTCIIVSGFAVRQKVVAGGLRQILSIHMKGEMVDLQSSLLGFADHSVQMLTAGKIAMITVEEIRRLVSERPAVGEALWMDTIVDASIHREWTANIGRRDARTRVAHLLCEFSLRLKVAGIGAQTNYELPMTQEHLADATGLTSVHINRTLKGLEADGFIERRTPRFIEIGDWKKLADVGDFNSSYLHLNDTEPGLAD